jgi:serine/threonine protein kinase
MGKFSGLNVTDLSSSLKLAVDEIERVQQDGQVTILRLLGSGAFGRVYLGRIDMSSTSHSPESHELVAIKRLILSGSHASLLKLLAAEVSMLRSLNHPNIVRFMGLYRSTDGRDPETFNILLEYVDGGSMLHLLQACGGKFDERYAAGLLLQLLHGLDYLHAQNVIHRDLKPANILVTRSEAIDPACSLARTMPVVKISDFGTAVRVCEAQVTHSIRVFGSS